MTEFNGLYAPGKNWSRTGDKATCRFVNQCFIHFRWRGRRVPDRTTAGGGTIAATAPAGRPAEQGGPLLAGHRDRALEGRLGPPRRRRRMGSCRGSSAGHRYRRHRESGPIPGYCCRRPPQWPCHMNFLLVGAIGVPIRAPVRRYDPGGHRRRREQHHGEDSQPSCQRRCRHRATSFRRPAAAITSNTYTAIARTILRIVYKPYKFCGLFLEIPLEMSRRLTAAVAYFTLSLQQHQDASKRENAK